MADLVKALTLGALTGFALINVTPSGAPISELPLALIPTAAVPLLLTLHITSMSALARGPRTPLNRPPARSSPAPRRVLPWRKPRQPVPGEALSAEEKTVQLEIDALKEAAAWPGADRRTPLMLASELMAAQTSRSRRSPCPG